MVCRSTCPSPIGELTLASDGEMLTGLWLAGQKYFAQTLPEDAADCGAAPVLDAARDWLARYFAGARPAAVVDSDAVFDIERSVHALPSVMTVSKPASAARTVASMIWAATPRRSIARTRSATGR